MEGRLAWPFQSGSKGPGKCRRVHYHHPPPGEELQEPLSQGKGGGEHGGADPREEGLWENQPQVQCDGREDDPGLHGLSDEPDAERPRPAAMSPGTPEVLGLGRVGGREDFSRGGLDGVWALPVRSSIKLGRNV